MTSSNNIPSGLEDQLVGRALLWDTKIDLDEQARLNESKEANRPYPYDVNFENCEPVIS